MAVWLPPSLLSLFVFNPSLGNEDTESAKLLYYYPPSTSLNSQKDAVGLIEAICGFSGQLVGEGGGADYMRGDEELHTVVQCEAGYYMVCVMKHSCSVHKAVKGSAGGGEKRVEWHEDELDEQAVRQQLTLAYHTFRTLNGTFARCAAEQSMDGLRARLDLFFRFWLPSIPFAALHLLSPLHGYQYLPVDSITYLTIQLLVNNIKANFTHIAAVSFLHDGRLIYTDVQGADMEALYALTADNRQTLQSYLAINEELTNRLAEAVSSTASTNATNGSNGSRSEASDSDIFVLPQSMYDKMAVKHYQGPQYTETGDADFMPHTATQQQSQQPADKKEAVAGASKRDNKRGRRVDGSAQTPTTSTPSAAVTATATHSTSNAASLHVGFLTGPYRSPLSASSLPYTSGAWSSLNSPMWTVPLPLTLEDRACVDSPRLFLQSDWSGAAADVQSAGVQLHRLVMYRRHVITLLFVVACESASPSSNNSPPLSLYDTLESFMHSTLKKIAALLHSTHTNSSTAATAQSHAASHSPSSPLSSAMSALSPSSAALTDTQYRFLYYNSMNLVLACTWDVHNLPLECVRGVRDCQSALHKPRHHPSIVATSSTSSSHECVIRLRSGQWVAGRRAAATQRHFIVLFDERLSSLHDVQREMDQLTRALFHNVCFE